jgi:Tol biopolymer transport system component
MYYVQYGSNIGGDLYVADINLAAGTVGSPSPIFDRAPGPKHHAAWSPDGRWLAYSEFSYLPGATPMIVIHGFASDRVRKWPLAADLRAGALQWSPDGKTILFSTRRVPDNTVGWFTVDAESGTMSQLLRCDEKEWHAAPRFLPDGRSTVSWRSEGGLITNWQGNRLVIRELATGREREIYRPGSGQPMFGILEVSPDGTQLAVWMRDAGAGQKSVLYILPIAGGEPRVLYRSPDSLGNLLYTYFFLTWTPDGQRLLFTEHNTLRSISVSGGEVRDLGLKMENLQQVRLRPDGRQIAFVRGASQGGTKLWVIDNLFTPRK